MSTMDWFKDLSTYFGLPGFLAAVMLGWFNFRNQRKIEKLKTDLREHEIRFSRLHERRVNVVAKLYTYLSSVHTAYNRLTSRLIFNGEPPEEDKEQALDNAWSEFIGYFRMNRIYLDKSLCGRIEDFIREVESGLHDYRSSKEYGNHEIAWKEQAALLDTLGGRYETLAGIREEIECKFRGLLGVEGG